MFELEQSERESLRNWPVARYEAFWKLQRTIDQVGSRFQSAGYVVEFDSSWEAYGFYLKSSGKSLLWVGLWTKAAAPLAFGFHSSRAEWSRPRKASLPEPTAYYHLWNLPEDTWDRPDKLFEHISDFLKRNPPELADPAQDVARDLDAASRSQLS